MYVFILFQRTITQPTVPATKDNKVNATLRLDTERYTSNTMPNPRSRSRALDLRLHVRTCQLHDMCQLHGMCQLHC